MKKEFATSIEELMLTTTLDLEPTCQKGWNEVPIVTLLKKKGVTKFTLKENGRSMWNKNKLVDFDDHGYIRNNGILSIASGDPASWERNLLNSILGFLPIYKLNYLKKQDKYMQVKLEGVSLPPVLLQSSLLFMHTMFLMHEDLKLLGLFDKKYDIVRLEQDFLALMRIPSKQKLWTHYKNLASKRTQASSYYPTPTGAKEILEWSRLIRGSGTDIAADYTKQSTPTHVNHFSEVLSKHVRAIGPFDDGERPIVFVGCMEVNVAVVQKDNWYMTDYIERASACMVYDAMRDPLPPVCDGGNAFIICDGYLDEQTRGHIYHSRDADATIPFLQVFSKLLAAKKIIGFAVKVFMFGPDAEDAVRRYTQFENVVSTIGGRPHNGERFIRCSGAVSPVGREYVAKIRETIDRDVRFYNDLRMDKIFKVMRNERTPELEHEAIVYAEGQLTMVAESFLLGDYFVDSASNDDSNRVLDELACARDDIATVQATKERMRSQLPSIDIVKNNGELSKRRKMLKNASRAWDEHIVYELAGVALAADQQSVTTNHWWPKIEIRPQEGYYKYQYDMDAERVM